MENESISQWVDTESLRALAEELMLPPPETDAADGEEIYGSGFVGFAEPEVDRPETALPEVEPSEVAHPEKIQVEPRQPEIPDVPVGDISDLQVPKTIKPTPVEKVERVTVEETPAIPPLPSFQKPPIDLKAAPAAIRSDEVQGSPFEQRPPAQAQSAPVLPEIPPQVILPLEQVWPPAPKKEADERSREVALISVTKSSRDEPVTRFESPFKIATAPIPGPEAKGSSPDSPSTGHPRSARLTAFAAWLKKEYPAKAYFVCLQDGGVIVDEVGSEKLINVARTLALASVKSARLAAGPRERPASFHVKVGPDQVMEVISKKSRQGIVILGVLVPRPLSREASTALSVALGSAFNEPGSAASE